MLNNFLGRRNGGLSNIHKHKTGAQASLLAPRDWFPALRTTAPMLFCTHCPGKLILLTVEYVLQHSHIRTTSISRSCSKPRKETEINGCLTGSKSKKGKSAEGRVPASRRMLLDWGDFKGVRSTLTEVLSCISFTFHLDHGITTRLR